MPGDPFYWSKEWRAFRASILRERPRCQVPGCREPSRHVDHIVSRRQGGLPFDPYNVQALCHSHHSSKTAQVDGGFGNRKRAFRPKGCRPDGWPLGSGGKA